LPTEDSGTAIPFVILKSLTLIAGVFIATEFSETVAPKAVLSHVVESSVEYSINDSIPWLKEFYAQSENVDKAEDIQGVVSGLTDLFIEQKYDVVDAILNELKVDELSVLGMVVFARSTYRAQEYLPSWNKAISKIRQQINHIGMDDKKVLRGIT
jgi:hypothetical protein